MHVPVIFHWGDEGRINGGTGFTRDISTGGVFVLSPIAPPVGTPVVLEVHLPPLGASGPGLHVQSAGRVVRIDKSQAGAGFAATAHFGLHNGLTAGNS